MADLDKTAKLEEVESEAERIADSKGQTFTCDRCGSEMVERHCRLICPNCGNQFDCSDLTLYFD